MVRCTFSPPRAWRPAVVTRLARTLGIREMQRRCASRKCACRRELSSHEAAKPQGSVGLIDSYQPRPAMIRAPSTRPELATCRSRTIRIERRSSNCRGKSDASNRRSSGHAWRPREEESSKSANRPVSTLRGASRQNRGSACKAQGAMQSLRRAPQTRSTATALAVALSRRQNHGHANSPCWQAAPADA